jgi:hypothetical protein
MVEFRKNVEGNLCYDRQKYLDFLNEDVELSVKWFGISFQLPGAYEGKEIDSIQYVEAFDRFFKVIISQLDNNSFWTINHEDKDMEWLPNDEDNLPGLRTLFKQNNIPNDFKGAILFTKDALLKFSTELISYPFTVFNETRVLYKNLDISHSTLPFIVKISGHKNIDLLSTDRDLLNEVLDANKSESFVLRPYTGTSL